MIQRMYGVEMEVPAGKLPGDYAQVIAQIDKTVEVFDRDQQLFILPSEEQRQLLIAILDVYEMTGELFDLWLLPPDTGSGHAADYGFTSLAAHVYLYGSMVAFFRLNPSVGRSEDRWAAFEQVKDHLLLSLPEKSNQMLHIIAQNDKQLVGGIARAFGVEVAWVTPGNAPDQ